MSAPAQASAGQAAYERAAQLRDWDTTAELLPWDNLPPEVQYIWEQTAQAAVAAYIELNGADPVDARAVIAEALAPQPYDVTWATGLAAREPDAAATAAPWRQGRSQPRNVYARTGGDDWKADQLIGHFDTAQLAAEACRAHNGTREPDAADGDEGTLTAGDFYAERAERLHRTGERDAARSDLARVKRAVLGTGTHQAKIKKILAIVGEIPDEHPEPQPAPGLAGLRESIAAIATGLQQRADINRPSKVTETCDGIAAALRKALEGK